MTAGSKLMDAQAAYESSIIMQSVPLAGANYVFHAAGWLEGGLSASFAKFVLDAEQMEMYHRLGSGVDMSDLEEALDAVREVGPGGHFLGTAHTLAKFQSAFSAPKLLDNSSKTFVVHSNAIGFAGKIAQCVGVRLPNTVRQVDVEKEVADPSP